jgi:hypothetical protein
MAFWGQTTLQTWHPLHPVVMKYTFPDFFLVVAAFAVSGTARFKSIGDTTAAELATINFRLLRLPMSSLITSLFPRFLFFA